LEVDASSEVKITLLRKLLKTQGEIVWLGGRDSNSSKRVSKLVRARDLWL